LTRIRLEIPTADETMDNIVALNLRLFPALDGQAPTETWLYEYAPPPADQRQHS